MNSRVAGKVKDKTKAKTIFGKYTKKLRIVP